MNRESINPVDSGLQFSVDQGEVIEGAKRYLRCSGQISVTSDADSELGFSVVSPGDIRGQMECALGNIDAVLNQAGMSRDNVVSLRFLTTDIDGFLKKLRCICKLDRGRRNATATEPDRRQSTGAARSPGRNRN